MSPLLRSLSVRARLTAAVGAAGLALLTPLVMHFEGKRNVTYQDIAGIPTTCYGHTGEDVRAGQEFTDAQCVMLLYEDLLKHTAALECLAPAARHKLTPGQTAAFVSFAYNVGIRAFCNSTLARKASSGDMPGACAELSRWVNAGGKPVRGLVRRRKAERALCEGAA